MEPIVWKRLHLIKAFHFRKEDEYTSQHDVNALKSDPTAGHGDEAGENADEV